MNQDCTVLVILFLFLMYPECPDFLISQYTTLDIHYPAKWYS